MKRLSDDIQWTTDLGNAFLAQQNDVMEAVQRMRKKATDAGNLKTTEQQKVETKVVESKQVIVIEQSNPEVVYVPSYNPVVVYGAPVYPYPPIAYPPVGYYAAGVAISFGVGLAMGAAWGGGWGYGCGWGGNNNVTINNNNNFNRNSNINGGNRNNINGGNRVNPNGNRTGGAGGNNWQHNSQHRGGTPYSDRSTANKYGGTTRGASASDRQANARQNQANTANRGQSGGAGIRIKWADNNRVRATVAPAAIVDRRRAVEIVVAIAADLPAQVTEAPRLVVVPVAEAAGSASQQFAGLVEYGIARRWRRAAEVDK